jgi:hypothetical protein
MNTGSRVRHLHDSYAAAAIKLAVLVFLAALFASTLMTGRAGAAGGLAAACWCHVLLFA